MKTKQPILQTRWDAALEKIFLRLVFQLSGPMRYNLKFMIF